MKKIKYISGIIFGGLLLAMSTVEFYFSFINYSLMGSIGGFFFAGLGSQVCKYFIWNEKVLK